MPSNVLIKVPPKAIQVRCHLFPDWDPAST